MAPSFVLGQGTILLDNRAYGLFDYPISDCRGPLTGAGWTAQLWGASSGASEEDLEPLLPVTSFRTDAPGYLVPLVISAPELGGTASVQLRVWDNESGTITQYEEATVRGASPIVEVVPGGWGSPPTLPAFLYPLGDEPLLVIQSPGCEPPSDVCCYLIGFSLTNVAVLESQGQVRLNVARNRLATATEQAGPDHTVRYVLEDSTAHSGEDYVAQSGAVHFASLSSGWIAVDLLDNPTWTGTREFKVRLFDPAPDVVISRNAIATVAIADNDTVLGPRRSIDGVVWTIVDSPDSRWLIGGDFTYVDGYRRSGIASLESDGTIHPGFDPGLGADGSVFSIARQSDGRILVAGSFTSFAGIERPLLVRLNSTGALDPDFMSAIVPQISTGGDVLGVMRHVVIQPDGKILVAGTQLNSGSIAGAGVIRLNDDGSLDLSFVPAAAVTNATILELQPDGKVLVGTDNGYSDGSLVRLGVDGALDPTFVADLRAIPHRTVRGVSALKILHDGRILAGNSMSFYSEGNIGLLVLEPDGQPATKQINLSIGGVPLLDGFVTALAWQGSDKLLIAGAWSIPYDGTTLCCVSSLLRLDSNLEQDTAFPPLQDILQDSIGLRPFAVQGDGTIGGITTNYRENRLVLLQEDGSPVQDLHFDGIARLPDGQVHLTLRGASPWTGYLQTSSDLMHWQTISNSYSEMQGQVFKDLTTTNIVRRFYRAARWQ
jgi:uncharacterized delta-60 repeat protein